MKDFGQIQSRDKIKKQNGSIVDADFGQAFKTKRLGIHWVEVPAGQKISNPHAESLEEEFIFVLTGRPHLWVNGYLYELRPGLAVGFPAGTGIAHTVINNTKEAVQLIVLGERTKKENKCSFPVNPELRKTHDWIWWHEAPDQDLGPHRAEIGDLQHLKDWQELSFVKDVFAMPLPESFSYRGDNEVFARGVRVTQHVGLKALGVWYEKLSPGHRASWPHAHKLEEEFGLILKGKPRVWLNGFETSLQEGDGVFFVPGTNVAHTLINDSDEDVLYLNLGLADDGGTGEKIIYPLHETRNEQCERNGYLWMDPPQADLGPSLGLPNLKQLQIIHTHSVEEFLDLAGPVLYEKEELYSYFLGLCEIERSKKDQATNFDYFILQDEKNKVIGACMISQRFLILSQIPEPALFKLAENLIARKIQIPGIIGPDICADALSKILVKLEHKSRRVGMSQLMYTIKTVIKPPPAGGLLKFADERQAKLITQWLMEFYQESLPHETTTPEKVESAVKTRIEKKQIYVWEMGGQLVSMAMVGRPTKNGISISGVYTPPENRKKGYASALVAAASDAQLKQGKKFCVLYTDAKNPTSNKIYQAVGFEEIGRSKHYLLE